MTPTDTVAGVVSSLSNMSDADLVGSLLGPESVTEAVPAPVADAPLTPVLGSDADVAPAETEDSDPEDPEVEVVEGSAPPEGEGEGDEGDDPPASPPLFPVLDREPITPFTVTLPDGTVIPIPDLRIALKANGKDQVVELDKLARLAQSGFYNESLVAKADEISAQLPEMQSRLTEREELLALREQQIERLLTDDDYLGQAREAFDSYSSPEQRAARAEAEVQRVRNASAESARQQNLYGFVTSTVMPSMEGMLAQYPTVSQEEVWGRFALKTGTMQVKGEIPPSRWKDVVGVLHEDIGPWMAQLHEHRTTAAQTAKTQTDQAVLKAQETAAKAKRTLAKTVRPTGSTGTGGKAVKPVISAQDAFDSILSNVGIAGL